MFYVYLAVVLDSNLELSHKVHCKFVGGRGSPLSQQSSLLLCNLVECHNLGIFILV